MRGADVSGQFPPYVVGWALAPANSNNAPGPLRETPGQDCGKPCDDGRSLLTRRGVPFTETLIETPEALAAAKARLGSDPAAPTLVVGREKEFGFAAPAAAAPAPRTVRDAAFFDEQAQRLAGLKRLRDQGLLSEQEYEQKRRQIIDGL